MLADAIVVSILQYMYVANQRIAHIKLNIIRQLYLSIKLGRYSLSQEITLFPVPTSFQCTPFSWGESKRFTLCLPLCLVLYGLFHSQWTLFHFTD